ncbi:MAG: hypothetical protein K8M05_12985 [Deltaproteobacteria bacterium]|nr:hypothetical protein [Kofleriaceae bacterium]
MRLAAIVARLALAALVVGAVACKKEAEPAKATSGAERGGDVASQVEQAGDETGVDPADRTARLPAMPRKLPGMDDTPASPGVDGEPRRRRGPWGDGPRPDRAEMKARRDERRKQTLDMYDADKNGELDDDERTLMHESRVADTVARMDQNADGKLTREELEASTSRRRRPPPDFDAIDADKDGFVTVEEMAAARRPIRGRGMPPAP